MKVFSILLTGLVTCILSMNFAVAGNLAELKPGVIQETAVESPATPKRTVKPGIVKPGLIQPVKPGMGIAARVKYTCSNGTVETTDATCGNRATCENLCQHSGGSGGNCSSSEYFCSVAQP